VKYVKDKSIQQSLRNVPRGVDQKEWEWLVKEQFASETFQARSTRNAANRAKLKMLHHIGSKPIREIIYQKLLYALRSTREDITSLNEENKSLNEENKSLNNRLSTLEDAMKEVLKMREVFKAHQSHVAATTSSFSTE
ncbi:hypothetical protein EJD97_002086, partial [Solanum chilense]